MSESAELPKLKPCPFCGVSPTWKATVHKSVVYVSIECSPVCYAHSTIAWAAGKAAELAEMWNTRKGGA